MTDEELRLELLKIAMQYFGTFTDESIVKATNILFAYVRLGQYQNDA